MYAMYIPLSLHRLSKCCLDNAIYFRRCYSHLNDRFKTFNEHDIYIKPFGPKYHEWIEADYLGAPMDIHTQHVAEAPLLSRNNTGMGFLILNSEYTGISQINGLYRRLADLETNVYKRFSLITSMTRKLFSMGLHPVELLMFKESIFKLRKCSDTKEVSRVLTKALDDYIRNICDLSFLFLTFKKPLIVYLNGSSAGYGGVLPALSNFGACHFHSVFKCNILETDFPMLGGLSFVMAMLRGCLGEYLALTGLNVHGADLVHSGLIQRFISPDAIEVLQLTADRLVDMPERATEQFLSEHFLTLNTPFIFDNYEWLIHEHFKWNNVSDIISSLDRGVSKSVIKGKKLSEATVKQWEKKTLHQISDTSQSQYILSLIKQVKNHKVYLLNKIRVNPKQWNLMHHLHNTRATTPNEFELLHLYKAIKQEIFTEAINLEIEQFYKIHLKDFLGIDLWAESRFANTPWIPIQRSGFAYSSVPGLKKIHPDYNPETQCDYDKVRMENLKNRFQDDFLQRELHYMKCILT